MTTATSPLAQPTVITIDGPAGVGKSTLARALAETLGMIYLDTGAMYRTLGLKLGAHAADLSDADLRHRVDQCRFTLEPTLPTPVGKPVAKTGVMPMVLACNGRAIGEEIRTEKAGRLASIVAKLPALRESLQKTQREMAKHWSLVAEGRDMGTRVFPKARYKFFLDARPEVRAERRFLELEGKGAKPDRAVILADIVARDEQDRNRPLDPLRPAPDAVLVDTSDLDMQGVLHVMLNSIQTSHAQPVPLPPENEPTFSHLDADGALRMVDVGGKQETERVARVRAVVEMSHATLALLRRNALPKGDVLTTAKVAGILAAKRTGEMIPLCHPLALTYADVRFTVKDEIPGVELEAEARTTGRTGVEMEALVAAQMAAATIYDMCKAVQKDIVIRDVRLVYKSGGKSGVFQAD